MKQAAEFPYPRQVRLPAILETTAECQLQLPPFIGCANGWAGSLGQFLAHVRDGEFLLECVPLASVVDQYLRHLNGPDLDAAGELLDLAASLIYWKSRLMLPCDPLSAGMGEDPRQEILSSLSEGHPKGRQSQPSPANAAQPNRAPEDHSELSLLELFVLLNEVEQMLLNSDSYQVPASPVTVAGQLQWLSQWFNRHSSVMNSADALFRHHPSRPAQLCLFLALLEMAKRGQLCLDQTGAFEAIAVQPIKAQTPRLSGD